MKWTSHKKITKQVFQDINYNGVYDKYQDVMLDYCIEPDKSDKNSTHHYGRENTIIENIFSSREYFLQDDLFNTFKHLGLAFHYIQDNWTFLPGRAKRHDDWETWISEAHFTSDNYLKQKISEYSKREYSDYIVFLESLSRDISYKNDIMKIATWKNLKGSKPWIDLNFSYRVSLKTAKAVLQNKTHQKIQTELDILYTNYYDYLINVENKELNKLNFTHYKLINIDKKEGVLELINRINYYILLLQFKYINYNYSNNNHLKKVVKKYNKNVYKLTHEHIKWYLLNTPELNYVNITQNRAILNK